MYRYYYVPNDHPFSPSPSVFIYIYCYALGEDSLSSTPVHVHSPSHGRGPVGADSETDDGHTVNSSIATGGDTGIYLFILYILLVSLSQLLDCKPDMINLMRLSTREGEINIVEESAHKYREIGFILLKDRTGLKVTAIEKEVRDNPVEAVSKIYIRWIARDVDRSWSKLAQCLRRCDLNVLASDIEKHFGLPSPQQPQESMLLFLLTMRKCCMCMLTQFCEVVWHPATKCVQ